MARIGVNSSDELGISMTWSATLWTLSSPSVTIAIARFGRARAARNQAPTFRDALLDIAQNRLHRFLIDHRAHRRILRGIANRDFLDALLQALQEFVVHALIDNGARARRAFLPAESKRRRGHSLDRGIEIGVGVHHDGVLAAHLKEI